MKTKMGNDFLAKNCLIPKTNSKIKGAALA